MATKTPTAPAEEQVSDPPEQAEKSPKIYKVQTVERVTRYYRVEAESVNDARSKFPFSEDESELLAEDLRGGHVHQVRWERDGS